MSLNNEPVPQEKEIYKSGNWKNYFLVILLVIFINLMTLEQGLVPTNVAPIQAHFGIEEGFLGGFIALYTVTLACMTLVFGYFSDKAKRINLLLIGSSLWAICAIFSYFSATVFQNIYLFATFRIFAGVGLGCLMPVGFSLLADIISSKSRSKAFAIWGIFTMVGALAGVLIGTSVFEEFNRTGRTDAWSEPFLFIGVVGLLLIILVFVFPEPKRAAADEVFKDLVSKEGLSYSYQIKFDDLKNIYKRKSNFWLIINFVDTIYPGLLILWVFTYLTESFGLSEGVYTIELIIFLLMLLLGLLLGTAIFAWLGDRLVNRGDIGGRAKVAVWCAILTNPFVAVAFIFPLSTTNYWWIGISLSIGLAINQGIGSNWYASIIDVNLPENRGTMIATASFLDNIGRAIGQWVGGLLIAAFTVFIAFQLAGIFLILQIPFWIPVLYYIRGDLKEVSDIMAERAKEIMESAEG